MRFSFIIINYNTLELSRCCLNSLLEHLKGEDFEIIMIDNGSRDNSGQDLKKEFGEQVRFIINDRNYGFAHANNQGAAHSSGDILFFLNSDTKIESNILPALGNIFNKYPDIGIVAPLVLNSQKEWQYGACGKIQNLKNLLQQKTKDNWCLRTESDYYLTDWVSGAALAIRRPLFKLLKGWDDKFFLYLEDADLAWRARQEGFKTAVCPAAKLIHYGGGSPAKNWERKKNYYRSQNYFFYKHYGLMPSILMRFIRWPYKTYLFLKNNL